MKKILCALTAAFYLSACTSMSPAPYEPDRAPLAPIEQSGESDGTQTLKALVGIALIVGVLTLAGAATRSFAVPSFPK